MHVSNYAACCLCLALSAGCSADDPKGDDAASQGLGGAAGTSVSGGGTNTQTLPSTATGAVSSVGGASTATMVTSATGGASATGGNASAGGTTATSGTASDPYAAARALCLQITNQYRATVSAAAITANSSKESCVDGQAQSDSVSGTAHGAFGDCNESAQNECPGWGGTPESVVTDCLASMFAEGPGADYDTHGHYINMTNTKYTKVACGFYTTSAGEVWLIQDFY